ncbi:MAG TPA: ABC transporter permease [Gemmatimonadales bacterium]|nr:ABC transporter permease [Gemmatimonadales bacterium]
MFGLFEGVGIALDSLRSNKLRAALTILGIAIGVMVVMVIAAMVSGINRGVADIFEQAGPRTFYVFRFFQGGVHVSDGSDEMSPWRRNPPLTVEEADRLAELPSISFVVLDEGSGASVEVGTRELASVGVRGVGVDWLRVSGGDVFPGRSFTQMEYEAQARVVIPNQKLAQEIFGTLDPIGRRIKIAGVPYEVIGVYTPPPDLFGDANRPRAVMPHATFDKYVPHFRGWINFLVSPAPGVTVSEAIDDVTAQLRSIRGLRPGQESNFTVVTQDKLLETWDSVTGVFFLVMIALSSVGLLVGGVGVIAIMMISVTERTREIGVRKALGARRREILWQFLVEAATLTLVGGLVGMVAGGLIAFIVNNVSPIPAVVPLWSVVVAILASILTGVGFGMYPAARAARLDPVEALRYE